MWKLIFLVSLVSALYIDPYPPGPIDVLTWQNANFTGNSFNFTIKAGEECVNIGNQYISSVNVTEGCVQFCPADDCKATDTLECLQVDGQKVADVGTLNDKIVSVGRCAVIKPRSISIAGAPISDINLTIL